MNDEGQMSFVEHLAELRSVIVRSLWGIALGFGIGYYFIESILEIIRNPILPYLPQKGLIFTSPIEKFFSYLKVALFSGVVLASPWWIYQIWGFIRPALSVKEKKLTIYFLTAALSLFILGLLFTYFVVFPMAFRFLLTFGGEVDQPLISIREYLNFFIWTSLSFGAAFELPLIVVTLGLLGVVNSTFLKANRKYVLVALSVLTAVITPPDLMSMLLMLAPMWLLFDLSIWVVQWMERGRSRTR